MYKNGKKLRTFSIVCAFMCVISLPFNNSGQSLDQHQMKNTNHIVHNLDVIIIPDDYPTIQQGIDHAYPGDTVFVRSGIYTEHLLMHTREVRLIGENKDNTIIDLENTSFDAVTIKAEGTSVQGFTIRNARCRDNLIWNQSGVVIFTSNVTVKGNIIRDNHLGILSYITAFNLTICDNMFYYDGFLPGCYLQNINGEYQGAETIPLESITLNVANNTINDKPLYYIQHKQDMVVGSDAGQVVLVNCTNITVKDLYLTQMDFSVLLYYCRNCLVENVTILDSDGELILFFSENNTIEKNRIRNAMQGICFDLGSKNNLAFDNVVCESMQGITILSGCSGNMIYRNKIDGCFWGLEISSFTKNVPAHHNQVRENEISRNKIGIVLTRGFNDPLCFTYNNTVENNTIISNTIGVELRSSEGNIIKNNRFKRNLLSAFFMDCSQNIWLNNYWNHPRVLPKAIVGVQMAGNLPIPWLNFDRHPAGFL